jgi:hypothetical protein
VPNSNSALPIWSRPRKSFEKCTMAGNRPDFCRGPIRVRKKGC